MNQNYAGTLPSPPPPKLSRSGKGEKAHATLHPNFLRRRQLSFHWGVGMECRHQNGPLPLRLLRAAPSPTTAGSGSGRRAGFQLGLQQSLRCGARARARSRVCGFCSPGLCVHPTVSFPLPLGPVGPPPRGLGPRSGRNARAEWVRVGELSKGGPAERGFPASAGDAAARGWVGRGHPSVTAAPRPGRYRGRGSGHPGQVLQSAVQNPERLPQGPTG